MAKAKVIKVELTEMTPDEIDNFFWGTLNKAAKAEKYAYLPSRAFKADIDARAVGQALREGCTVAELDEIV